MGEAPGYPDEDPLVEGREEEDGDEEEEREATSRNLEAADVPVHEGGLLDGEGGHLGVYCPEEYAGGPNW